MYVSCKHLAALKHSFLFIVLLALLGCLASQQGVGVARETVPSQAVKPEVRNDTDPQPASQSAALKLPLKDPRIVVLKRKRRLELYSDGALVRTYKIGLGLNPVPDKER